MGWPKLHVSSRTFAPYKWCTHVLETSHCASHLCFCLVPLAGSGMTPPSSATPSASWCMHWSRQQYWIIVPSLQDKPVRVLAFAQALHDYSQIHGSSAGRGDGTGDAAHRDDLAAATALHVHGFDAEQIWGQLELQGGALLRRVRKLVSRAGQVPNLLTDTAAAQLDGAQPTAVGRLISPNPPRASHAPRDASNTVFLYMVDVRSSSWQVEFRVTVSGYRLGPTRGSLIGSFSMALKGGGGEGL